MSRTRFAVTSRLKIQGKGRRTIAFQLRQKQEAEIQAAAAAKATQARSRRTGTLPKPKTEPIFKGTKSVAVDWTRLDLAKIEVMATSAQGISGLEALQKAKQQGKVIVPSAFHEIIASMFPTPSVAPPPSNIVTALPAWTGTVIIYLGHNQQFRERVFLSWERADESNPFLTWDHKLIFNVPKKFQGLTNHALVIEHPNFEFILNGMDYELKPNNEDNIHAIVFPYHDSNKRYYSDQRFGVPNVEAPHYSPRACRPFNKDRKVSRYPNSFVGLISWNDDSCTVCLTDNLSDKQGVLVIPVSEYRKLIVGATS